jgi:hypothetical protein
VLVIIPCMYTATEDEGLRYYSYMHAWRVESTTTSRVSSSRGAVDVYAYTNTSTVLDDVVHAVHMHTTKHPVQGTTLTCMLHEE